MFFFGEMVALYGLYNILYSNHLQSEFVVVQCVRF